MTNTIKHVAIYLRISRDKGENVDTLQNHRERLVRLCEDRGYTYTIYEEIVSGQAKMEDRDVLTSLLDELEKYDGVVTVAIDRLSRDLEYSIHIFKRLEKANIPVITPERIYTEQDFTLFAIESTLAHGEYKQIRKRMLAGKKDKALRGEIVASRPPFGYVAVKVDGRRTFVPNKDADLVKRIFNLACNGYGCVEIEKRVGKPYKSVQNILKNIAYTGTMVYKDITVPNAFESIIDTDTFNKAQESTKARYNAFDGDKKVRTREKGEVRTILKDLLYCDECNLKICFQLNSSGHLTSKKCKCGMSGVVEGRLLAEFYHQFASTELYFQKEWQKALDTPIEDNRELLEGQIAELNKQQDKLTKRLKNAQVMRMDGELTKGEFEDAKREIESELKTLTDTSNKLNNELASLDTDKVADGYKEKLEIIGQVKDILLPEPFMIKGELTVSPLPTPSDKVEANRLLKMIIDKIYYRRGDVIAYSPIGEEEVEEDTITLMIVPK